MDRLLQIIAGFQEAKILLAAAELGVFDHLRGSGGTAGAVAAALDGDLRGTEILLDALAALALIEKTGDRYRNRAVYEPFLTGGEGPAPFLGLLRHRNRMFRNWALLEERVRGEPLPATLRDRDVLSDPRTNEAFILAMWAGGTPNAPLVADHMDLSGVRTLADLGGGPGHYLAEFARRAPDVEPYLIDLPLTLQVARRVLADSPVFPRIRFVEWDFYNADPPAGLPGFDLVYVSSVLHSESPERNRALLARVFPLVAPGGRVVVQEHVVEPGRTSPPEAALFAVNMLASTPAGRTYTEEEILSWGEAAGFVPEKGERLSGRSYLVRMRRPR
jgi:predicted nicotinamide N-methyase